MGGAASFGSANQECPTGNARVRGRRGSIAGHVVTRLVFGAATLIALTLGTAAPGGAIAERTGGTAAGEPGAEFLVLFEAERSAGGYGDAAPLAAALLRRADATPDRGESESLARLAAVVAPSDPRPPAFLAKLYLAERPLDAAAQGWRFLFLSLRDPWVQAMGVLRLGAATALGAWAAALALLIAGSAGRVRLAFHDYRDSFPRGFRAWTPGLLLFLITVALWTAGAGPALFLLLAGLAFAPYYPLRGRWALGLCLGVGCLLMWALGALSAVGGPPGERAWALYRVWKGDGGELLDADLRRVFQPDDPRGLFARARIARRGYRLEHATGLLEQALAQPSALGSLLHQELGTLRFQQGRSDESLEEFSAAAAADPTDPMPWLNRHVVHLSRLELGLADEALERARVLGAFVPDRSGRPATEIIPQLMPTASAMPKEWVREELLSRAIASPPWVERLSKGLFLPISGFDPAILGLLALGPFLIPWRRSAGRRSHSCPSCGSMVCPRCGRRVKDTFLCPACWAAGQDDETDSAEKERHLSRIAEWKTSRDRWVLLGRVLFPGWSDFLVVGSVTALAVGILWAGLLGWAAQTLLYPVPVSPWSLPGSPWGAFAAAAAIHAAGVWVWVVRRSSSGQR